jgi:phage terminase Nu1 subunit (DNA packaging protein)
VAKPKYAQTKAHLAIALAVSRQSLTEISRHPEFPKQTRNGWNIEHARKFMEKHGRGKHASRNGQSTKVSGETLTSANIRRTLEQAENERIKKERQLVEQAKEFGSILDAEEVRRLNLQIVSTIRALHDSFPDSIDRLLPEAPPAADAWPEIRERVIALANKLGPDAYAAMKELA